MVAQEVKNLTAGMPRVEATLAAHNCLTSCINKSGFRVSKMLSRFGLSHLENFLKGGMEMEWEAIGCMIVRRKLLQVW